MMSILMLSYSSSAFASVLSTTKSGMLPSWSIYESLTTMTERWRENNMKGKWVSEKCERCFSYTLSIFILWSAGNGYYGLFQSFLSSSLLPWCDVKGCYYTTICTEMRYNMNINAFAYSFSTPFYYTIFCRLCAIDSMCAYNIIMYVQVLLDWNVGIDAHHAAYFNHFGIHSCKL